MARRTNGLRAPCQNRLPRTPLYRHSTFSPRAASRALLQNSPPPPPPLPLLLRSLRALFLAASTLPSSVVLRRERAETPRVLFPIVVPPSSSHLFVRVCTRVLSVSLGLSTVRTLVPHTLFLSLRPFSLFPPFLLSRISFLSSLSPCIITSSSDPVGSPFSSLTEPLGYTGKDREKRWYRDGQGQRKREGPIRDDSQPWVVDRGLPEQARGTSTAVARWRTRLYEHEVVNCNATVTRE